MGRKRRSIVPLAVAILVSVPLVACTDSSGSGGGNGQPLRIGTSSGIDSLNPFVGFNQDAFSTWMYIYPSLLQYDTTTSSYDYLPNFAQSWKQSTDGLTVTFQTLPNATWSDGQALTAEDVAWSFTMIMKYADGPTSAWAGSVSFLKSVKATGANTVVATYEQPSGIALFNLGLTPILPPQVWQQYATGDGKDITTFPNEPTDGQPLVGGGPFILTSYKKNDIALFQKNPTFYGQQPRIDGFGLQFFRDEDAMVTALKTDQLDAINEIPPTSATTLKDAGMTVYQGPALSLRDFIFNVDPNKKDHRELLDPKVREAFEYAIDRASIVQTAWLGYASPGTTIVPPSNATGGTTWHDPSVQPLPFDTGKANQILDSLGFQTGADGIRVADGHPMAYDVIFPQDEEGAGDRAFQIIQNDLKQVGVSLTQKKLDDSAAWDAMWCGNNCGYDFDLAMWDWFPAADPDFILSVLTCDQYGGWSDTGYCSSTYDKLYTEQQAATDPQDRQKIIFQMQDMAYTARPYIILTYDVRLDAWSPTLTGLVESPQGFFNNFSTQSLTSVERA